MINSIDSVVNAISGILYRPYIVPLFLIGAGIIFTILTKFIQIRMFGEMFRVIKEKPKSENGMSSFAALMVSTASRVGTGNIIGVSTAVCLGGPGAMVWMWITAIFGGASAFIESTLAQIYKKRDEDGSCYGGPSYYMKDALNAKWLGGIFSVIIILTYAVGYNMLAAFNLQSSFAAFSFYGNSTPYVIGIILAVLFGAVILGGAKRLANVTGLLVPIMGVIYILVSIIVILMNAGNIGHMFGEMFASAFDFKAIFGGFTGSCVYLGLKRGLYSNEAGMGSAPNAAASADVSHPAKQGLVQMLSVFIDTLLICSATGLMCLSTGIPATEEVSGAPYVQQCLGSALGGFGPIFIAVSLALFAFTTLIGNYYYCEGCLRFLKGKTPSAGFMLVFRLLATLLVFLGAIITAGLAWDTADMLQGFMVVINIPVILILARPAIHCLNDYVAQKKEGRNPEYIADRSIVKCDTDFWK